MKLALVIVFAGVISVAACNKPSATATPSSTATVGTFDIRESAGVGPVELGMTASDVEAKLGTPEQRNAGPDGRAVFMEYMHGHLGVYFDHDARVRMIIANGDDGTWCTSFDVCLYHEGDLAKLKAHHGDKLLRFVDRDDSVTYRFLIGDPASEQVMTEYTPAEAKNAVVQVAILKWYGPITQSSVD